MAQAMLISRKRPRHDSGSDMRMDDDEGSSNTGGAGPGADGRFLSLKAPVFRVTCTRRIYNTITEGQFFWPMYMYLTPYVTCLKLNAQYGPVNQVVDYLISRVTPLFHQATNFKTSMRISHITSNIATASGAAEVDTVAGNNSPFLNIGRDGMNMYKSLGCALLPTPSGWTESALRDNNVYACMHNGGVYTTGLISNGVSDANIEFGTQGPYSLFSDVQTLQSGSGTSWSKHNNYHAPDGHAFVVPSIKDNLGPYINTTIPKCVVRMPFPTAQMSSINTVNTGVGANPPTSGDSVLRTESDIANINLNSGGEAICMWVNSLNPDKDSQVTLAQKLQISFIMELTVDIDVKINYTPNLDTVAAAGLYTDGPGTNGKVVAMPSQMIPTTTGEGAYWAFGDALRPAHHNHL